MPKHRTRRGRSTPREVRVQFLAQPGEDYMIRGLHSEGSVYDWSEIPAYPQHQLLHAARLARAMAVHAYRQGILDVVVEVQRGQNHRENDMVHFEPTSRVLFRVFSHHPFIPLGRRLTTAARS